MVGMSQAPQVLIMLIASQLAMKTWASDVFGVDLLKASQVSVPWSPHAHQLSPRGPGPFCYDA